MACGLAGCVTVPTVNDMTKQEFISSDAPSVHLALRGCRNDRQLTCQVFLLTAAESLWISSVEMRQPDGAIIEPKRAESLDTPPRRSGPQISIGFGIPLGGNSGGSGGDCDSKGGSGSFSGIPGGMRIPVSKLLRGLTKKDAPRSLQLTYELDEGRSAQGCELTVRVRSGSDTTQDAKNDVDNQKAPTAASTQPDTQPAPDKADSRVLIFAMGEQQWHRKDKDESKTKEETKQLIREIKFTLKQQNPA